MTPPPQAIMMNLSTKTKQLRIASISDIHLGHKNNPTEEIIANLRLAFPDNAQTAELDFIFIVGDVFDGLLNMSDPVVWEIKAWVYSFLRIAKKHDIAVRIVKGTPSHDWDQSLIFQNVNTLANIGADLKYFSDLHIEHEQAHDITCLFVPDECEATTEKTLSRVKQLLKEKGLDKVDYALMHGQFEYQLPSHVKAQKHDSSEYLSLVRHLIFIGHVHKPSHYERIIAQGSFDRLKHNEEEAKGHYRVVVIGDEYECTFVENKGAKIFKTIDCTGTSIAELLERVHGIVKDAKEGSYFRIEARYDHPIFANMLILELRYPLFHWSKLSQEDEATKAELIEAEEEDTFVPLVINEMSVLELMRERLSTLGLEESYFTTALKLFHREIVEHAS
jgi:DNA repair exonuclease SbcCD nuclease subunit